MTEGPSRSQIVLYLAAALAVLVVGGRYLLTSSSSSPAPAAAPAVRVQSRPAVALVHVAGAVRRPGVYRMRGGDRLHDAVERAGGATARADLSAVNLAAKVEDGRQVLVPERASRAASSSAPGPAEGQPVSLSTATPEQLDTLPGVGPATAEKILAYRDEHGGFGSVDDLANVPGIGDKRLAALKDLVRP